VTKRTVDKFRSRYSRKTAEYVVAHAKWQRSRGRQPSESYKGEANPKKALELALKELKVYEPQCGEMVNHTAARIVEIAKLTGNMVTAKFNDIELKAWPMSTARHVIDDFHFVQRVQSEQYRRSPAGLRAAKEAEDRKLRDQQKVTDLMQRLPTLDFTNLSAVIDWLGELQDPSDHIGVTVPHQQIVETFKEKGFLPNVNCGKDFKAEDEENVARWIIGQALGCLECDVHAIHQVFGSFADKWRKKFRQAA